MEYNLVVCGGTFDHLHKGHEAFLRFILSKSQQVMLGLTTDEFVKVNKTHAGHVQSFEQRKQALQSFLQQQNAINRITIAPIHSVLYPKSWEQLPFEAIIVTEDTIKGAQQINEYRKAKGLSELKIVIVPLQQSKNGDYISATNIRLGKINQEGTPYVDPSWFAKTLVLPEEEKKWFKKPFGNLTADVAIDFSHLDRSKVVTVGDFITKDFNEKGVGQKLSIIDFVVQRKKMFTKIEDLGFTGRETVIQVDNPAGNVTPSLFTGILHAVQQLQTKPRIIINVNGEEDLAVIPLILALPLGYLIFYGQPNEGVVSLNVSLETKDMAYEYLKKFKTTGH